MARFRLKTLNTKQSLLQSLLVIAHCYKNLSAGLVGRVFSDRLLIRQ